MSKWIKNTGVQPVADDVLVDVKFDEGDVVLKQVAHGWIWEIDIECSISHWRLSSVPAKEPEDPLAKEETFVGLEEGYNEIHQENIYANLPKGLAKKLACEAVEGLCDEDFPKARKTDEQIIVDILLTTTGKKYATQEIQNIRLVSDLLTQMNIPM